MGGGRRGAVGGLCPESSRGSWAAPSSSACSRLSQAAPRRPPQAAGRCPSHRPQPLLQRFHSRLPHLSFGFQVQRAASEMPSQTSPHCRAPPRPALCSLCSPPFCLPYTCEHHSQSFPYPCASSTSQKLRERSSVLLFIYRPSQSPNPRRFQTALTVGATCKTV